MRWRSCTYSKAIATSKLSLRTSDNRAEGTQEFLGGDRRDGDGGAAHARRCRLCALCLGLSSQFPRGQGFRGGARRTVGRGGREGGGGGQEVESSFTSRRSPRIPLQCRPASPSLPPSRPVRRC